MDEPYPGPDDRRGITAHDVEGEEDLRRAKEYAEMIVDTVREGLVVLDFELRIEAANESFYRMFEVAPSETEGRLIYELDGGQWDIPELRELLEEILPEHEVMSGFEVTHDFERVGERTVLLNARQLNDHQKILLAFEDITEHREAKRKHKAVSEDLEVALDAAQMGTWDMDLTIGTARTSLRHNQIFGYEEPVDEWSPEIFRAHILPKDRKTFEETFGEALETGSLDLEVRVRRPDGTVRWIRDRGRVYYDEDGRPVRMAGVTVDITERKEAEAALRESEKRYRTLFNSIDEGFCVIEVLFGENEEPVDYRFLETNPAFEEQTGLRGAKGKRMQELVPEHEEHWFKTYGHVAVTGESKRFVGEANALGQWYDVYAFRIGEPEERKVAVLFNDITEQKETETALREREERLRTLSRSLEERVEKRTVELQEQTEQLRHLTAELASAEQRERRRLAALLHDELQQLLYSAGMQLTVARSKAEDGSPIGAAVNEASKRINEAVEAARDLTRQLRPPALYEAGLTPALEWLASEMDERYDLEVTVNADEVDPDAAERSLSDDVKAMLFDCVRELLFNVVKYAGVDRARVVLQTGAASCDIDSSDATEAGNDRLRLLVEDEGRGFEVEAASASALGKGSQNDGGFGLLSIRERIAALGGATTIASNPGEGTRVELSVPLAAAASDERTRPAASARSSEGAEPPARAERAQVRVVIADDHAVVRQGIANLLADDERLVVVGEAADGHEAVSAVERHRPDVVLIDVNMPRMNGVEATRRIHRRWPTAAVVGMSVQADSATEQAMLNAGAMAFVPKSGDADHLIDTTLRVTEHRS